MSASLESNLLVFVIFSSGTPPDQRFSIHNEYYFDRSEKPTVIDLYHAARGRMLISLYDMKPLLDFKTLLETISQRAFIFQDWTSEYSYEEAVVGNTLFGRPPFFNRPHLKEQRGAYPDRSSMSCTHVPEVLTSHSTFRSTPLFSSELFCPTYLHTSTRRPPLVINKKTRDTLRQQLAECGRARMLLRVFKDPRTHWDYEAYVRVIDEILAEQK